MEIIEDIINDPVIVFDLPNPEALNPPMFLRIEDGIFGYN